MTFTIQFLILTFPFHENSKGLIPTWDFLQIRHVKMLVIIGHKGVFAIAHDINVSRLGDVIMALRNHFISEMCFEYTWDREACKLYLDRLDIFYGVRERFERNNQAFYKRHSCIQSTIINFPIVNYLPYYFLSPC